MLSIPVPTGLLPVGVDTHTLKNLLSPLLCQQMTLESFASLVFSMGAALFHDNTLRPLVAVGPPFTTPGLGMLLPDSSAVGVVICIYRFNLYLQITVVFLVIVSGSCRGTLLSIMQLLLIHYYEAEDRLHPKSHAHVVKREVH